jgi:hypothetical protein
MKKISLAGHWHGFGWEANLVPSPIVCTVKFGGKAVAGIRGIDDGMSGVAAPLLKAHFKPTAASEITIIERRFPFRMRADL